MEHNIDNIYGMEKYVVSIHNHHAFLRLPGDETRAIVMLSKVEAIHLYEWALNEMRFYDRMYQELKADYDKKQKSLENIHYYTDEEIKKCGHNISKIFEMEYSNSELLKKQIACTGLSDECRSICDKYFTKLKLLDQLGNLIKNYK